MATLASTTVVTAFDPAALSIDQRRDYLRALWRADVDPLLFVGTARRLGYVLGCYWDVDAGMPVLTPIVLH
ncbi:hypothetical protein [Burkholderia ubonensis]|uniref:Uncharacterized protein n=1 Tax=Burkholderia ubonensis TaxID=101571 RepID=A0A105IYI0_9BURK|nr:hypothetical protein [Burkholderia ubonensis]KVC82447.1 hypothetical protein WI76_09005 [Burkholderia ubonensis]KVS40946.1 hypothetical protein WK37_20525 [Burkholderia ubonensis]KVS53106.1 hypothetical protein WK38_09440 [Burkholderia ubonensis]KVS71300.1 hypothetical protein WK42_24890 [Burkholderia ubonensis]KVS83374.1 hypothetical protein WK43_24885 [Burkholderia ubonensis]